MKRRKVVHKIQLPIRNREVAGQALANELARYRNGREIIVLALPRGGVPVAAQVANALRAPLDLMLVRKLGTPERPELAMGAIASGGKQVLNTDVVRAYGISSEEIAEVEARERKEIARRAQAYRGKRPAPQLEGRLVMLVDDGLATGVTMRAAIDAARAGGAHTIIVAVPVAPLETLKQLKRKADEIYCLASPHPFFSIGQWYQRFDQVQDEEVIELLKAAWDREPMTDSSTEWVSR